MRASRMPLSASIFLCAALAGAPDSLAQRSIDDDNFRQLEEILPTPNTYRTGSGAPGHEYWQQRAEYIIDVTLDEESNRIIASETITYHNNSPDTLPYLWLQLDNNIFTPTSASNTASTAPNFLSTSRFGRMSFARLDRMKAAATFDGGVKVSSVADAEGNPLAFTTVGTMMRTDLLEALEPGASTTFSVDWSYAINNTDLVGGRTGYDPYDDGNNVYGIAHWYPRMAAYTDVNGWQHKQFLGRGEFTLEMSDFEVSITVPDDHVVASTGVLQNPREVLTPEQRERLDEAMSSEAPIYIVTPEEAEENESSIPTGTKTWVYHAQDVRDFAFASSRKFIWDACVEPLDDKDVLCMSYFPKEGDPLWSQYSTQAVAHTVDVYSKFTFDYPYPVAISVMGIVGGGMEFPMICFNGPKPEEDGTYSKRTKYGLISVIIHEVGHNWFPMIVNSDERQWTWMDEGLNSFLQILAEQEWEHDYPSRRGLPDNITGYMSSTFQVPIMTNSESILQFGANAYTKPATALNILRETIMGRELFDFAFKEYSQRWMFKRPQPSDFFRTMEDASGVDLDWFWRGWFYTADHVDISIDSVSLYTIDTRDPVIEKEIDRRERDEELEHPMLTRNRDLMKRIDRFPDLKDFYNEFDELDVTPGDRREYEKYVEGLEDDQQDWLKNATNFYVVDFTNHGGLVMPIILWVEFTDGSGQEFRIPAEIWRRNSESVSKLIWTDKTIESIALDPNRETADVDYDNNYFPPRIEETRFEVFKSSRRPKNPMQEARDEEEREQKERQKESEDKKKHDDKTGEGDDERHRRSGGDDSR
ncbi:MAG: M1 family metallopeptidase [Phycisphaerales bacterium JB043]